MARAFVRFLRRGRVVEVAPGDPARTLLDHLRLEERSTGTKEGCAEGDCGACTVALGRVRDGELVYEPVTACIHLLGLVDGAELVTVEDLAEGGALHPVQQAMVDHHASQCGFCTPGFVMSLFALHHRPGPPPERAEMVDALAGNLCRCTGYRPIVDAGLAACAHAPDDAFAARARETRAQLEAMDDGEDVFVPVGTGFLAAPADADSLADLYAAHPDAVLVAGASDVGLWVTKGFLDLPKVILINRIKELHDIVDTPDELVLGAGASHARIRPHLAAIDPDLGEIWRRFGGPQIRAAGTIGGNIANASPIGDGAPAFIALGAELELRAGSRVRRMPLEDFFLDYGRQDRGPGEFLTRLRLPKPREGAVFRAYKVSKRVEEDISAVLGAFALVLDGRRVAAARIAYGGMAAIPKRAAGTEAALAGADLDAPESWRAALEALGRDFAPIDDHRASAGYRARVAGALLRKALIEAAGASSVETRVVGIREVRHGEPA